MQIVEYARYSANIPQALLPARPLPGRNLIISSSRRGTQVIEAAPDSGALITANFALALDREAMAVPVNITRKTSHGHIQLPKQGAYLVTELGEVLELLQPKISRIGTSTATKSRPRTFGCSKNRPRSARYHPAAYRYPGVGKWVDTYGAFRYFTAPRAPRVRGATPWRSLYSWSSGTLID